MFQIPVNPLPPHRHLALPAALLQVALLALPPAQAQQAQPITLDDVVDRLQANLDSYKKLIPSFLCDERLASTMHQDGGGSAVNLDPAMPQYDGASAGNYETIAESVFRLKRDEHDDHTVSLDESREIRTIDGRPANGHDLDGPAMLSGAFSGGLAVVSEDERACMTYTLEPFKPREPIVVRFSTVPAAQRPKDCILLEDGSGRVVIDPPSMQISRVEFKIPHHVATSDLSRDAKARKTITKWNVAVDYAPVRLDNRIFWLPKTIESTQNASTVEWSFRAIYRNYHKLEVNSRIVIPNDPPKP